ncbi:hypothetical protein KTO58_15755 [Chitinophaga pendula]|uniref:hypothetical protein n=1 Tax=Chitinophaga TaxID=79328 RepID=UPI0012FDEA16|nr:MULTISPECIES: hypothetical protein [Chitinophaga]UCJ05149.1 hypothetical protein KTO58_15755 [Chitinophaga pendula]
MKKENASKLQLKKIKVANLSNMKSGGGLAGIFATTTDPTKLTRCFICPPTSIQI